MTITSPWFTTVWDESKILDTQIRSDTPTTNYIGNTTLNFGVSTGRGTTHLSTIFQVDMLNGPVESGTVPPADAEIRTVAGSSKLSVYQSSHSVSLGITGKVALIQTAAGLVMTEVTWNEAATGSAWSVAGGESDIYTITDQPVMETNGVFFDIDITEQVRAAFAGTGGLTSLLLYDAQTSPINNAAHTIQASDSATESQRPSISVEWRYPIDDFLGDPHDPAYLKPGFRRLPCPAFPVTHTIIDPLDVVDTPAPVIATMEAERLPDHRWRVVYENATAAMAASILEAWGGGAGLFAPFWWQPPGETAERQYIFANDKWSLEQTSAQAYRAELELIERVHPTVP